MNMTTVVSPVALGDGRPVNLDAVCLARENRQQLRESLCAAGRGALIVCTLNIPGAVKDCGLYRRFFAHGLAALRQEFERQRLPAPLLAERYLPTGPEAWLAATWSPQEVKRCCLAFEDNTTWGRLFDIDVYDPDNRSVSRTDLGYAKRRCFVCDAPAAECGRQGRHTPEELQRVIHGWMQQLLQEPPRGWS